MTGICSARYGEMQRDLHGPVATLWPLHVLRRSRMHGGKRHS